MMLDSKSLPIEGIVHWADKLRGFSAGEAALEAAGEIGTLLLPTGKL